jgi:propanol-preferring alcohol dehydrogenase
VTAWAVGTPAPAASEPLVAVDRAKPEPATGQIRVRVTACGVCRTDLHLAEGDLPPRRHLTVPGHEIVGVVDAVGAGGSRFEPGQRVGIAWLRSTCGRCRWCRAGSENLCEHPRFTGWDDDGGFAEWAVADEAYAYALPDRYDDVHAAPLLCAGIIGYRSLRRADLPPGGRLGIYGFGASAHLTAQVAMAAGATVHVMTRSADARELALELGVHSAGLADAQPPEPLDAAIVFAPAGELVPVALRALDRGGKAVLAGIHMSPIPPLDHQRELFDERELRTVTANTRRDGEEFLAIAANLDLHVVAQPYPLGAANQALRDLAEDRIRGAAVLIIDDATSPQGATTR